MKLVEWVKWRVAPREMEELERWRIQWEEHRRWFAEFPIAAVTLDHLKAKVEREPVTSIHVVRDSCRSADVKQVRQNHTAPPQRKPLTDEEIRPMCKESWVFETVKQWVRIVEAAHGIKESKP